MSAKDEAPVIDAIMAYEAGELDDDDTVALFQRLINSGLAWTLQGHYGRQATRYIEAGLCTLPGGRLPSRDPIGIHKGHH